jgi:hypothetical protein
MDNGERFSLMEASRSLNSLLLVRETAEFGAEGADVEVTTCCCIFVAGIADVSCRIQLAC